MMGGGGVNRAEEERKRTVRRRTAKNFFAPRSVRNSMINQVVILISSGVGLNAPCQPFGGNILFSFLDIVYRLNFLLMFDFFLIFWEREKL